VYRLVPEGLVCGCVGHLDLEFSRTSINVA
jgi:hypothetical protein